MLKSKKDMRKDTPRQDIQGKAESNLINPRIIGIKDDESYNLKVATIKLGLSKFAKMIEKYWGNIFEDNFIEFERQNLRAPKLYESISVLQKLYPSYRLESFIKHNFKILGECFNLSNLECHIAYMVFLFNESCFNNLTEQRNRGYEVLATLLDTSIESIRDSLSSDKALLSLRILERDSREFGFNCKFRRIFCERQSLNDIINKYAQYIPNGKLEKADFAYMSKQINMLFHFCRKKNNASIFLYGLPGVGKNEIVGLIAKLTNKKLLCVRSFDEDDDYESIESRIGGLFVLQRGIDCKNHIILFDECEDLFEPSNKSHKAYFNKMLESIQTTTFFLSNSANIDEAYLRRFDIVLEIKAPPKNKKIEIINNILESKQIRLDSKIVEKIVDKKLSQGILIKACNVAKTFPKKQAQETFVNLINEHLKTQNKSIIKADSPHSNDLPYSLNLINASIDMKTLSLNLRGKGARILAYGLPGSGKSAFAKELAKQLNKKIIIKQASNLLSCYVGMTEKNIAKAFCEAREKKAILVFDEVDSFLAKRSEAVRSYEVTQVNEMLTQMENFEGIFIATTNLLDSLDSASLRRFDIKIAFYPLSGEKLYNAFKMYASYLLQTPITLNANIKARLDTLCDICLGDFALIARQHRFLPLTSCDEFLTKLSLESSLKRGEKTIGF